MGRREEVPAPKLSGSGNSKGREGQLWPGRDGRSMKRTAHWAPFLCPGYSLGVQGTCVPRKSPVMGESDPEKTQASSGSQIDMHLRRKNGVSWGYRIWGTLAGHEGLWSTEKLGK